MPAPGSVITPGRINMGKANIWIGVTAPADDTIYTLSSGEPTEGTFLGSTLTETVFVYTPTYVEIAVEQALTPVDAIKTMQVAELDVDFAETNVKNVTDALSTSTQGSAGNVDSVFMGDKVVPTFTTIMAVQQRRDDVTKYNYLLIYKVFAKAAISYPLAKAKPSGIKVKFSALSDTTRALDNRLFDWHAGV